MNIKKIVKISLVAGLYTCISIAAAPLSFGVIQVRLSEVLSILPVFSKIYIYGLTIGCFLTNTIGAFMGINIAGFLDIIIGTAATFLACWLTYLLRNFTIKSLPIPAILPPILVNAIFIGYELSYVINGGFLLPAFLITALQIAVGQTIALTVSIFLFKFFVKTNIQDKLKEE